MHYKLKPQWTHNKTNNRFHLIIIPCNFWKFRHNFFFRLDGTIAVQINSNQYVFTPPPDASHSKTLKKIFPFLNEITPIFVTTMCLSRIPFNFTGLVSVWAFQIVRHCRCRVSLSELKSQHLEAALIIRLKMNTFDLFWCDLKSIKHCQGHR